LERASVEELARREWLAQRVIGELAAAGLPVVPRAADPALLQGAEVYVDPLAAAHASVIVSWHCHSRLDDALHRAVQQQQAEDPAFRHWATVLEAMRTAVSQILSSAGYTVRDSTNDYAPLTLEVLDGPGPGVFPLWWSREQE
jgi:hypothetical protein